ncbi:methyltransferase domain-containing protein [Streptomyces sp. NPDC048361]|uniref:class I SAM-dependent methyltransferase n=1 Tax=Streptomyces sp. NPDC048361 TaxID=3154720 RepID=UPI0034487BEF
MAESFGEDAERYDRARPRYPDALIHRIRVAAPGPDILDVGCGTGIAARQLQAAGCRVLGVEPDARMAGVARGFGLAVEVATFEEWTPQGREFDAVTAGQAWHWIDPVAGAAQAARVLRPGGCLTAFWSAFQLPDEVADALTAAYVRAVPDAPAHVRAMLKPPLDAYKTVLATAGEAIVQSGTFGAPEQWRTDWESTYTRDALLDQLPTTGLLTRLPARQLAPILREVGEAVDALGGAFTMRYATVAITAVRAGRRA